MLVGHNNALSFLFERKVRINEGKDDDNEDNNIEIKKLKACERSN
jgi:hypothetical protein